MMEEKISEFFSGDAKIETKTMIIDRNILRLENATIQIRNISQFNITRPTVDIHQVAYICLLVGVLGLFLNPIIGIIILVSTGFYFYKKFEARRNVGYFINLHQNGGHSYYLYIKDKDFLDKVRSTLESCFNHAIGRTEINVDNQTINHQANINHGGSQVVTNEDSFHNNSHNQDSYNTQDDHSVNVVDAADIHATAFSVRGAASVNQENTSVDLAALESGLKKRVEGFASGE